MSCSTASASRRSRRLPGMAERTLKAGSAGKIFSLTGWKVGWIVASPENGRGRRPGPPVPDLRDRAEPAGGGGLSGWSRATPGSSRCAQRFARARDRMREGLRAGRLTRCCEPASTYFLCVDLTASGIDVDDESFRHGRGRAGGGRDGADLRLCRGQIRRAIWSGSASPSATRPSTPGSPPWRAQRSCSHEPGRRSRRHPEAVGSRRRERRARSASRQSTASEIGRVHIGDRGEVPPHGRDAVLSSSGESSRRRAAASWSGCSARNCARRRSRWPGW